MSYFIETFPALFNVLFVVVLVVLDGLVLFITSRLLKLPNARLGRALGATATSFIFSAALVAVLGLATGRFYVGGVPWIISEMISIGVLTLIVHWRYETTWRNALLAAVVVNVINAVIWNGGWFLFGRTAFEV